MSDFYGPADETESVATVHAALDAGITLLDTGDFYGMGHNEMLLSQVLKTRRKEAFICVKFGAVRTPDGAFIGLDLRPGRSKIFSLIRSNGWEPIISTFISLAAWIRVFQLKIRLGQWRK